MCNWSAEFHFEWSLFNLNDTISLEMHGPLFFPLCVELPGKLIDTSCVTPSLREGIYLNEINVAPGLSSGQWRTRPVLSSS